jgi:flagellar biosynthetic protein FlhB
MANKDPSKTEKPTAKRIQNAREDGNVMVSQDITSIVVMIGVGAVLAATLNRMAMGYNECLRMVLAEFSPTAEWDAVKFKEGGQRAVFFLGEILAPVLAGVVLFSYVATKVQVGKYFSMKPLAWKFDALNPAKGLQKVLPNVKNTMMLGLVILKVIVVASFVYLMFKRNMATLKLLPMMDLFDGLRWIASVVARLAAKIFLFFIIIAVLDYIYKRYDYFENLKMSKQEVKDEQKNAEGDPAVKSKIRQKMMKASLMRLIAEVPKADVVVTNPTHVAVALKYEPGGYAPMVVAKGLRKRAGRIKEIAREFGVPIVEAPPLARSLYRLTKVGGFIPEHLFSAVAIILARIHARRRKGPPVRTRVGQAVT